MTLPMSPFSPSEPPAPETAYRLVGELDGQPITLVLSSSTMAIGAHPGNQLVLEGPGISRRHAVLSVTPDGVIVEDQESKNGTWVNGRRSALSKILPGDELALGSAVFRLEEVQPEDARVALVFEDFKTPDMDRPMALTATRAETDLWQRETDFSTHEELAAAPLFEWLGNLTARLAAHPGSHQESALESIAARLGYASAALLSLPPGGEWVWTATWGPFETIRSELQRCQGDLELAAQSSLEQRAWIGLILDHGFAGMVPVAQNETQLLLLVDENPPEPNEPLMKFLGTLIAGVGSAQQEAPTDIDPGRLQFPDGYLESHGEAMMRLYRDMEAVADSDYPVLVLGETGSGKEMISQTLHRSSPRATAPFITINCAAIPGNLLEAEMFGVAKGAATGVAARPGCFVRAQRGTLFLDEIGELHLDLQAKLLRALEYGEVQPVGGELRKVDVRVIAATNVDLERRVDDGTFRADLYYRLAADVVQIPPLRLRQDDLPVLIQGFVQRFSAAKGVRLRGISQKALDLLLVYPWPGNIRELQHELRRAVQRSTSGQVLDSSLLSPKLSASEDASSTEASDTQTVPPELRELEERDSLDLRERLAEVESELIREALRRTDGNKREAAKLMGISRNTLAAKAMLYGIT